METYPDQKTALQELMPGCITGCQTTHTTSTISKTTDLTFNGRRYLLKSCEPYHNLAALEKHLAKPYAEELEIIAKHYSRLFVPIEHIFTFQEPFGYCLGIVQERITPFATNPAKPGRQQKDAFKRFVLEAIPTINEKLANGLEHIPDLQLRNLGEQSQEGRAEYLLFDHYPLVSATLAETVEWFFANAYRAGLLEDKNLLRECRREIEKYCK